MKAIIMAGGQGTRLRPLTCNIPKPMMPILDKPVIGYTIELLKKYNITDIGITLGYLPDEVMSYYGDGRDFGVNITYFIEESPLGTAGSVKNAEEFLNETFIVISGDALTDIDISKAIEYHKAKNATATIVLKEVPVPLEYGVVLTDKEGKITGFLEKPSWGEVFSDKANTGIYVLEPEIFSYYEKNQQFDFSSDLFPILLNNQKNIYGFISTGYWCDIGNIEQYMKCHYDLLKGIINVNIKGEKYKEGVWIGQNCEISHKSNLIPPVYIGDNCKIYSGTEIGPFSVLGRNNIISNGATIKRSVFFDNCYVGSNTEVKAAVLCKNVQLETGVCVFEEAAIGNDTIIKERAIIKPGVSIWPNKEVEGSTVVKSNIIWGGKFSKSLFGKMGISGEVNIDITPEFVSKLGSAYGSLLKYGSKVAISCSDDGAAQMFKYSLATGLLSMGIEVYDLKRMTTPMTRQAAIFFGVQGAIHVVINKDDSQKVNILFFDRNGLNIDKSAERGIENSFIREDFRRVKADSFKKITHLSDCVEYYSRRLVNRIEVHNIRNYKFKVILSVRNGLTLSILQNILSELKVNYKIYNEVKDIKGLSKEVLDNSANMGIYISDESENAIIIDENGNIIKDKMYEAINAMVFLKAFKFKTLVVPVTASLALESIAKSYGVEFIRTKTSQKNILEAYLKKEKKVSRKELIDIYIFYLDSVGMFLLTLNFMAINNITLSQMTEKVEKLYSKTEEIVCPWDKKGLVMRTLIEQNSSNSVELIEGVKLNYSNGWALILPDKDEPLCRMFVEGSSLDLVESIAGRLSEQINNITGKEK